MRGFNLYPEAFCMVDLDINTLLKSTRLVGYEEVDSELMIVMIREVLKSKYPWLLIPLAEAGAVTPLPKFFIHWALQNWIYKNKSVLLDKGRQRNTRLKKPRRILLNKSVPVLQKPKLNPRIILRDMVFLVHVEELDVPLSKVDFLIAFEDVAVGYISKGDLKYNLFDFERLKARIKNKLGTDIVALADIVTRKKPERTAFS